jgi:ADP-ribosyl-[dinitrogen reductase] hydrolase
MYKKKYTGCLLGSAVGDALGMQTEGMSPGEIKQKFNIVFDYGPGMPGTPHKKLRPGQYTDDTEQTLILARSIAESGKFDPELFSKKLVEHYKMIVSRPGSNRGWGRTSLDSCKRLQSGTPWKESGGDSPTCGSSMRISPIGLIYPDNLEHTEKTAVDSSLPTHRHPESIAGAVAVASAVSLAITNTSPDIILTTAGSLAKKYDSLLGNKINSIEKMRYMPELNAFSIIGTSLMTRDVVPSAFYCFSKNPLDFSRALITAVNAGGDTDSIAAITGAISGAYLGIDVIPKKWLDKLENRNEIESLALELWEIGRHNMKE